MIGLTNAIEQRIILNIDSNTWFLITDTIEDKSQFHSEIINNLVTINSSNKRDGRNSIYIPSGGYLRINKNNMATGSADLTVEWWEKPTEATNANGSGCVINFAYGNSLTGGLIGHNFLYREYTWWSSNGSSWNIMNNYYNGTNLGARARVVGEWQHYAFIKQGQIFRFFFNGTVAWSLTVANTTATNIPDPGGPMFIGAYFSSGTPNTTSRAFYIQDLRVSRVARYTSAFTPPERFI